MNVSIKLILISSLSIASAARAQQPSITPYDIDLTNYQYPYPVQFISLNIQGEALKMAYMDVKPSNPNGHVVMLLHGKNFNGAYWRQTARVLAENGYRVIVPDQIGFGKSSKATLSKDYPRIAWNSALTYDMIYTQPVCYEFENIKAPTLLIIGQLDRTALGKNLVSEDVRKTLGNYPVLGKLTHEKIKGSQLIELDGLGHVPHIEVFDRFIYPLLQFLK